MSSKTKDSQNTQKTVNTTATEAQADNDRKDPNWRSVSARRQPRGRITLGERVINVGVYASIALLVAVGIYNCWLYVQIFKQLLPLPWSWLQTAFGVLGWVVLQTGELLAMFINSELGFMALLAVSAMAHPNIKIVNANPIAQRIADRVNSFPARWMHGANVVASFLVLVDVVLVWLYFQPIQLGGFLGFLPSVNFTAFLQIVATVGMFQAVTAFALFVHNGKQLTRQGREATHG
jgi:hypothetical protein